MPSKMHDGRGPHRNRAKLFRTLSPYLRKNGFAPPNPRLHWEAKRLVNRLKRVCGNIGEQKPIFHGKELEGDFFHKKRSAAHLAQREIRQVSSDILIIEPNKPLGARDTSDGIFFADN
jgi:hypothetical protein